MDKLPEIVYFKVKSLKKMYFDNEEVERLMIEYRFTECTDVELRDKIMAHTSELIIQVIRVHGLAKIFSEDVDLIQTAWMQVEKTLYKYRANPHHLSCYQQNKPSRILDKKEDPYDITTPHDIKKHGYKCQGCGQIPDQIIYRGTSKIFCMWSQVVRTVALAYIKKESRDAKNSESYKQHSANYHQFKRDAEIFTKFIKTAKEILYYDEQYLKIIEAIEKISRIDPEPYQGIVNKIIKETGLPKSVVTSFMDTVRLRQNEFNKHEDLE